MWGVGGVVRGGRGEAEEVIASFGCLGGDGDGDGGADLLIVGLIVTAGVFI